ncbi:MAG: antibiotic biosynthesis monooxygenase family protein [Sporichthyaceae bacterium]
MNPRVGQVITVFRSRLMPDHVAAYTAHAEVISELARRMPGYVEHKVFTAPDGERVTLVTFADRVSHDAWRDHPEHRDAQRAGVAAYYQAYSIAVGTVEHASSFVRDEDCAADA